ncbi:MAG TPA: pyridoxal phosphate-dependent aminotransferase family protein [Bacteroidales bacterium]|nr:pyridoxal phosphate-dependent aminotransferase family protein [Bacteroidales bacterium]
MVDIFDKIEKNRGPLGQYQKEAEGYFMFPKLVGEIGPYMKFKGKEVLNWSLNNYLGLANHPEVRKADAEGAAQYGLAAPMGARMMSGQTDLHEELEARLAKFTGREAAYLANFGYQAMISILDTILNRNDVVVYDSEAHACIIDGLRLHLGKRFVYPHNNIANLEKELERATKMAQETKGGILVITEGVFGMSGDLGKLDEIVALKKKFNFRLMIDDAHGFGTMGPTGAGTDEHFGVQKDVDIYFGTFAKSMALIGAFVAAKKEVIDFLRYNMRSQIFAKSLPMPCVVGALKRLDLIENDPSLRTKLWEVVNAMQSGLKAKGFNLGNSNSPVTPVFLNGSVPEATAIVYDLRENYKIFCSIVTYPVVPKGVIMLRIIPTASHTLKDVERTISAFTEVAEKLKAGKYQAEKIVNVMN